MGWGNSNDSDSLWQWPSSLAERIPQVWFVKGGLNTAANSEENQANVLDAHARRLVAGEARPNAQPTVDAETATGTIDDELAGLTCLAEEVSQAIHPAQPTPTFRRELRRALLSAHRQQAAQRKLFAHPLFEMGLVDRSLLERMDIKSPWFWQIAAALPVLIAVAALLWRYTHRPVEQTGEMVALGVGGSADNQMQ